MKYLILSLVFLVSCSSSKFLSRDKIVYNFNLAHLNKVGEREYVVYKKDKFFAVKIIYLKEKDFMNFEKTKKEALDYLKENNLTNYCFNMKVKQYFSNRKTKENLILFECK